MVETQFAWTFPGGKKTIAKDTAVAGNVTTIKTVPAGKIWLITNVRFTLTTDGTVADRYCKIVSQDIVDALIFSNVADAVVASQTGVVKFFIMFLTTTDGTRNALGYLLLTAGEDLALMISNGVAGDAYDYLVEYLEIDKP